MHLTPNIATSGLAQRKAVAQQARRRVFSARYRSLNIMKKLGLISIFLLIAVSCGIERNEDGSKLFKFYYLNGTLKKTQLQKPNEGTGNGYWKYYDEDGDITKEFQRTNGQPNGMVKFYWKNGNLKAEEFMVDGVLTGSYTSYYESGRKEYVGKKIKGKFEGIWLYFDEDGDTLQKSLYKNGKLVWEKSVVQNTATQ